MQVTEKVVMTFHQVAIREAFKYDNKYYRKIRADRAVEAVSGKQFIFPLETTVEKDKQCLYQL